MDEGRVRTIHYYLGITYVWFLLIQVSAGLLLSLGGLSAGTGSTWFQTLAIIHTDWYPLGGIFRVILGLATITQGILGITIFFLSRSRYQKSKAHR
jgi:hypothetical protein